MFNTIMTATLGSACLVLVFKIMHVLALEVHWHKVNPEAEWF